VTPPVLTVRSIRAVAVKVPMTYVLGTSQEALREAPLLLVDLETEEGVTGHAYQFCYVPAAAAAIVVMLEEVLRTVKGDAVEPTVLWEKMSRPGTRSPGPRECRSRHSLAQRPARYPRTTAADWA
jgi:mandelate racemase